MLTFHAVPVAAIVPPAGADVPGRHAPPGETWARHDTLVLDKRLDQAVPDLHVVAGMWLYRAVRDAGLHRVVAVVRRLEPALAARLREHYAVGGLTSAGELDIPDRLARQVSATDSVVAWALGAEPVRAPEQGGHR